jgi:hypothetical protein
VAQLHFTTNDRPFFLSDDAKPEERGIGKAWVGLSLVTASVIVFAVLSIGNPIALLAMVTPPGISSSSPQDGAQSMATIPSLAIAEVLPPAPREAPSADELIAAFKGAFDAPTEAGQPSGEALFKQFQSWAAEENLRSPVRPLHGMQDARAQVVQKARARPLPKPRPIQAEQTARAQDDSLMQNAQWPARSFGWRD